MKRQHFYMSEFQFTLGFQGKTESFNCQQSLTFRSQLRDICKNTLLSVVWSLQTSQTTKAFTFGFIFWVVINGFQFCMRTHFKNRGARHKLKKEFSVFYLGEGAGGLNRIQCIVRPFACWWSVSNLMHFTTSDQWTTLITTPFVAFDITVLEYVIKASAQRWSRWTW